MKYFFSLCIILSLGISEINAQINYDSTSTVLDLVNLFNSGNLVEVSNITINGISPDSAHVKIIGFSNGSNEGVGIDEGMIMCTGSAYNMFLGDMTFFNDQSPDEDVTTLAGNNTTSCAILEFDVQVNADALIFKYVFASKEYPGFTCSLFNDSFGFFVSGPGLDGPFTNNAVNIALIPGSDTPVGINTVNSGIATNPGNEPICEAANPNWIEDSQYFVQNQNGEAGSLPLPGYTVPLEAFVEVEFGETYHMKLAVCDVMDGALNSAVLLEGGTFEGIMISNTENTSRDELEIFPNPAEDFIQLENFCKSCQGLIDVVITDINGKTVHQSRQEFNPNLRVPVSDLDPGFYLLSVFEDGQRVVSSKLVKR